MVLESYDRPSVRKFVDILVTDPMSGSITEDSPLNPSSFSQQELETTGPELKVTEKKGLWRRTRIPP